MTMQNSGYKMGHLRWVTTVCAYINSAT